MEIDLENCNFRNFKSLDLDLGLGQTYISVHNWLRYTHTSN